MQNGFYIAGIATSIAENQLGVISNNLANVNTVGFKSDRTSFSTFLNQSMDSQQPLAISGSGSQYIDMSDGIIQQTGNDLDMAIQGDAFFHVRLDDGSDAYTRAGNFRIDADGQLITQSGQAVLDDGGNPITLPAGHLTVGEDGNMSVDGNAVGRIGLVKFNDPKQTSKMEGVLIKAPAANVTAADSNVRVVQGAIEGSNVNSVLAMTEMITVTRNYESMMRIIEQYNNIAAQLSDRVGMVNG